SKEAVTLSSTFAVDKDAAIHDLRSIVERTFREIFESFKQSEERLREEVERVRREAERAREEAKEAKRRGGVGGGGGGMSKEQIRQQIQVYTREVHERMERERSELLGRAVVAERLLSEKRREEGVQQQQMVDGDSSKRRE
ncbi:hypothetical protein HDU67_001868, partial [Dinochytrium kinnereticum]